MEELFTYVGVFLVICVPVAIVLFTVWKGQSLHENACAPNLNEQERERREYETMLRHRRRARLDKQFGRRNLQD